MCRNKHGFTLVELLVVIAIIAMLVLLLLPAINAMRDSARRTQCIAKTSQLVLAVQAYENTYEVYPIGVDEPSGPIVNRPVGNHHGWLISLLPYMEETILYRQIDHSVSVYHRRNAIPAHHQLEAFACPSDYVSSEKAFGYSSYAGVHHDVEAPIDVDNNGVFFLKSRVSRRSISDGISHTLFIGEISDPVTKLGWMSGTRATLRNTGTGLNMTGPNPSGVSTLTDAEIEEFNPHRTQEDESDPYDDLDVDVYEDEHRGDDEHSNEDDERIDDVDVDLELPAVEDSADSEQDGGDEMTVVPHAIMDEQGLLGDDDRPSELELSPSGKVRPYYVGGFGSEHLAPGAVFAFGDGHVKYLPNSIDGRTYQQLANRHDGQLLDEAELP